LLEISIQLLSILRINVNIGRESERLNIKFLISISKVSLLIDFVNLFNGFTCKVPDSSWLVRMGRGIITITNREAFILFRIKRETTLREMLNSFIFERQKISSILGIPMSDPLFKISDNVAEVVSVDPSHYYWFVSGDDSLQSNIFFFNPIPYESITKIVKMNSVGFSITYATPLGKFDSYLHALRNIAESIRFKKPEVKSKAVNIMSNYGQFASMQIPANWNIRYSISTVSSSPMYIIRVFDSADLPVMELNYVTFQQMLVGMGFSVMGQGSIIYDNISMTLNYIQDISPQKILDTILPLYWTNQGFSCNPIKIEAIKHSELYDRLKKIFARTIMQMTTGMPVMVDAGDLVATYRCDTLTMKATFNYVWSRMQLPNTISDSIAGSILIKRLPLGKEMIYDRITNSIISTVSVSISWIYRAYQNLMQQVMKTRRQITKLILDDIRSEIRHRRKLWEMARQTLREIHEMHMDSMRKEWEFQRAMANAWTNLLGDTVYVKDESTGEIYHIWDLGDEYWIDETGQHILALNETDSLLLDQDLIANGWRKLSKSYEGFKEQLEAPF